MGQTVEILKFNTIVCDAPVFRRHLTHLLDVFVDNPIDFEGAFKRRVRVPMNKGAVNVVSVDDLILMKKKAGRRQDQEDIQALKNIRKRKTRE